MLPMVRYALAAFALMPIVAGGGVTASPAAAQVDEAAFEDLFNAIEESLDKDAAFENTLDALRRELANVPHMAALEQESPGLINDAVEAMRPSLVIATARADRNFRRETVSMFRENLTEDEAIEVAEYFRDPVIARMLGVVSRTYSPDAQLENIESKTRITQEQIERDARGASNRALAEISSDELEDIERRMEQSAAWRKFVTLRPQMTALRAKVDNAPLSPQEQLSLDTAIEAVLAQHFPE